MTSKKLTDEEIMEAVLQSSQDDEYDSEIFDIDQSHAKPEANEEGGEQLSDTSRQDVIPVEDIPIIILPEEITDSAEISKIINSIETGAIFQQRVDYSKPNSDFVDIDNLFETEDPTAETEMDKENNPSLSNESLAFMSTTSKINNSQSNKSCMTIRSQPSTSQAYTSPGSLPIKSSASNRLEKNQGPPDDLEDPDYDPDWACLSESSMDSDEQPPRDPSSLPNVTNKDNIQDILDRDGHQNEEETIVGENRKRKKNNSDEWKRKLSKKQRMAGKEYLGYRRTKDGKCFHDVVRSARNMGERCTSKVCEKSKVRFCNDISNEERELIFNNVWSNIDWEQRKMFFVNTVEKEPVKRRTKKKKKKKKNKKEEEVQVEEEEEEGDEEQGYEENVDEESTSRRKETLKYYLMVGGKKMQVCQKMYLNTLGIKKWTIRYWISGDKFLGNTPLDDSVSLGMAPNSSVTKLPRAKVLKKEAKHECLERFLNELPKMPSHYCRKNSSKLYIEPIFDSISHLYNVYSEYCNALEEKEGATKGSYVLSRCTFDRQFNSKNLSIFQLKKDKCDVCASYEVGNVSEDSYKNHIALKDKARLEKSADKEKAKQNEIHVYTSDVEAVKVAPYLKASALYYKTKLVVHNFTMYNLGTKEVDCFWFDETAGDLEASVFASCVVNKLDEILTRDPKPVVLWSDGCGNQNRNCIFSNALLNLAVKKNVQIEQKFLLKGHTQMECDSVHSNIEEKLKNKEIYIPSQYHSITKEARKNPFPYSSHYLTYSFFKDFSKPETMVYNSIRPGRVAGDPTVHDIKAILYRPDGKIETKTDFSETYQELPRRPKKNLVVGSCDFPQLYTEKRKIPISKWKHLQELKFVLPEDVHQFYDSLPKE